MRTINRTLLYIFIPVLCMALAGGGLLLASSTPAGLDMIRKVVQTYAPRFINGRISIDRIEGNLWKKLILHDLSITLPDSLGGDEVIGADQVTLSINYWKTLVLQSALSTVMIDGLRFAYIEGNDIRRTNTISALIRTDDTSPPEGEASSRPTRIPIPELHITRGQFLYFDPDDSTTVRVSNIFLRGRIRDARHFTARIGTHKAAFDIGGYQDSVSTVYLSFQLAGDTLRVHELNMEAATSPPLAVHANGAIVPTSPFPASLTISGNGHTGVIARIIGIKSALEGNLSFTGSLTNSLKDPVIEARLESPALQTDIGAFTRAAVHLNYGQKVLTIDRYTGLTAAGRVSGEAMLDVSRAQNQYRLSLHAEPLTLEHLPEKLVGASFPFTGQAILDADLHGIGFDNPALTGTLRANIPSLQVAGTRIGAVDLSTEYDRGSVRLSLDTPYAVVRSNGRLSLAGDTDFAASIDIPNVQAFVGLFGDSSVTGAAELTASIRGPITQPDIQLKGQVQRLGVADIPFGTMDLTGSLSTDLVAQINAAIDSSKIRFSAEAVLAGEAGSLSGTMRVHDLQLRDYLTVHDTGWNIDGIIEVEGSLGGAINRPEFQGKGLLRSLSLRGEHLGDTNLSIDVNDRDLEFTVESSDRSVFSNGVVSFAQGNPYDIRVDLNKADLHPLLAIFSKRPIESQAGRFTGRIQATGFAAYPDLATVTMALDSMFVSIDDRELHFAAPSTIRLDRQIVTVDRLELSGDFGHVLVNGIVSLARDGLVNLEALVEDVQLDFLSPFLLSRGHLGGTINAQFSLIGSPEAPVLDGSFTTAGVVYDFDNRINQLGSVTAEFQYEDRLFQIPYLSLDTPIGTSYATVNYPVDISWGGTPSEMQEEQFTASLLMDHLSIGPLREFIPFIPADLDGRINGSIELTGPTANPQDFTGTVQLDSLRIASIQYELVNEDSLQLRLHKGVVDIDTIQVVLRQLDEQATLRGRLKAGGRLVIGTESDGYTISDFVVAGRQIAIEGLLSLLGEDIPLTGALSGDMLVVGPPASESMEGRIQLSRLEYNLATIDSVAGHVVFDGGELRIREFQAWAGDDTLYASGTIPFDREGTAIGTGTREMALTVQGREIDLNFLRGLVFDLERIEGKADVRLSIGGPPTAPKSVGEIVVRAPLIQLRNIRPPLQASMMRFDVDGNQISLQPVVMKAGSGNVHAYARLVVQNFGLSDYEFHTTFSRADIELIGSAKLRANGTLSLRGNDKQSVITSQALMADGTVTHPLTLGGILLGGGIIRPRAAPNPFLERMSLDVAIDIPDLRIRNRLADISVQGGLGFSGTAQNPVVTGNAIANEEGRIVYLDTRFDVLNGRLEFVRRQPMESFAALIDDPVQQLDPELTIQAEAPGVRDIYGDEYDVSLNLSGRATQPNLQLTAIPVNQGAAEFRGTTLAGPEVVSLLTIGLPGLTTGGGENAFSSIRNRALLMATGNQAERLLRLDEVRLEGDILGGSDTGTPAQITISKRINRRTQVSYTSLIDSADFKIRIGYQLSRLLFIETHSDQISDRSQTGLDLKLKFRFR